MFIKAKMCRVSRFGSTCSFVQLAGTVCSGLKMCGWESNF